jgi:hypothetical protein
MNNQTLIDFLSDRPSINRESFRKELQLDKRNFYAILRKDRDIPQPKRGVFYRTLKRYGHVFDFDTGGGYCFYPV